MSGRVVDGYAVLQPRVTPSLPTGRDGSLFQRVFSGDRGLDPYAFAVSDVYQDLFGEGSFTGKGIYDVDAFEAALQGPHPREHHPQPRSARRDLRARRAGHRHRGGRGISLALRRRRGPPASLGARRLAAAALDLRPRASSGRPRAKAGSADRPLEDARQSAPTLSAPPRVACACWLGGSCPSRRRALDGRSSWSASPCPPFCPCSAGSCRAGWDFEAHAMRSSSAADFELAFGRSRLLTTFLAHQAWLMADAIAATLSGCSCRPQAARMGHGRAGASSAPISTLAGFYRQMAGGCRARPWWPGFSSPGCSQAPLPLAAPFASPCGCFRRPSRGGSSQSAATAAFTGRCQPPTRGACAGRAAHLALLRNLRHGRGPHAAAGQFPGGPDAGRGASHLADQYRALSALRSSRRAISAGSGTLDAVDRLEATFDHDGQARALPRPFLQLVRHARSAAAASRNISRRSTAAILPAI